MKQAIRKMPPEIKSTYLHWQPLPVAVASSDASSLCSGSVPGRWSSASCCTPGTWWHCCRPAGAPVWPWGQPGSSLLPPPLPPHPVAPGFWEEGCCPSTSFCLDASHLERRRKKAKPIKKLKMNMLLKRPQGGNRAAWLHLERRTDVHLSNLEDFRELLSLIYLYL